MSELLAWIAPGAPILAALVLLARRLAGERDGEAAILRVCSAALALGASTAALLLAISAVEGPFVADLGAWLPPGLLDAPRRLVVTPLGSAWATVCLALTLGVVVFNRTYLHREPGFLRAVALSTLFGGATALVGLAGDAVTLLAAWELAGTCSVLLIAYFTDRTRAVEAGWRALVAGRVADVALLGVIIVLGAAGGSTALSAPPAGTATLLAALVAVAAAVKGAQVPFSGWLARASEGPTTTSALFYGGLMTHAPLALLWRTEGWLLAAPGVRLALGAAAGITLLGAALSAATQGDVKRHLVLSSLAGVSALILVAAAGAPGVALALALHHLVLRTVQVLLAPSWIAVRPRLPARPPPAWLRVRLGLYTRVRQGLGLEAATDRLARALVREPSRAAAWVEHTLVEPLSLGALPVVDRMAALVATEERHLEPFHVDAAEDRPGLVATTVGRLATAVHRVEDVVVADLVGRTLPRGGLLAGARLAATEAFLARPVVQLGLLLIVGFALAGGLS